MSENQILEDNAKIILENLKEGILSPRDVTQDIRRVCVEYLHRQGEHTQEEMAKMFWVSTKTIQRDIEKIESLYANMLTVLDYKRIIGNFLHKAGNLRQKALAKQDYRLAWQIELDLIDKYMELGLLKKPPEEMGVKDDSWTEHMTPEEEKQLDDIILNAMERRNRKKIKMLTGKTENEWFSGNDGGNGEYGNEPNATFGSP